MSRWFNAIWASILVVCAATSSFTVDEYAKASMHDTREGERISSRLYERCLEMDTEACFGYKLVRSAASFFQQTTGSELSDTTDDGTRAKDTEGHVDEILLQKFFELVTPSSIRATNRTAGAARRKSDFCVTLH
jgi:hypothetical protein